MIESTAAGVFGEAIASVRAVVSQLPIYTSEDINWAASVFRGANPSVAEIFDAMGYVGAWRTAHELPVMVMQDVLNTVAKSVDANCVVTHRLKRLPTIINKCKRYPDLALWEMQDLGGLRVILNSSQEVYQLNRLLEANPPAGFRDERVNDYIAEPKRGYRSLHRIYSYTAADEARSDELHIEVQLRSRLQHAWATSNEIVGTFRREELKSNLGAPDWLRYFVLAGSKIATQEGGKLDSKVKGATLDAELDVLEQKLHAFEKITGYSVTHMGTVEAFGPIYGEGFLVVALNLADNSVNVSIYRPEDFAAAQAEYAWRERESLGDPNIDVVLVFMEDVKRIEEAYPNYFADTGDFLHAVYPDWKQRTTTKMIF